MQQARCTRTNERHSSVYWWINHGASVKPSSIRCTSDVRNNGNECGGDGSASHLRSLLCLRPYCNGRHKTHFTRQLNSFSLHALRFHCWIAPPDTFSLPIICFCRAVHRSILFSLSHFAKCRKNAIHFIVKKIKDYSCISWRIGVWISFFFIKFPICPLSGMYFPLFRLCCADGTCTIRFV